MRLLLLLLLFTCSSHAQNSKLLASCCTTTPRPTAKDFGRCSGDGSCTACKNCSACKHCSKEGGSCGVCSSYSAPQPEKPYKSRAKSSSTTNFTSTGTVKPKKPYKRSQMLEVTSETLSVRKGPGKNHKVVEVINYGDMVTYVSQEGEWLYIRVDASGTNGWVNYKFVK
jgi:uncharacterized protein YgiM (DUF1202 family)